MEIQQAQGQQDAKMRYVTAQNPSEWPVELDAVIAASDNHRVLFENDLVRVVLVTQLPRTTEEPHHHRWPSVLCLLEAEHLVDHDGSTGEVVHDTRLVDAPLEPYSTIWKGPEGLHFVENPTDTTIRLLRIEMKMLEAS